METEPVYDIHVGDGLHEFFANGVLVHNTGWEPPVPGRSRGSGWSPDRSDAMVHAIRACIVDDKDLRRFGKLGSPEPTGPEGEVLTVPTARWRGETATHGLRLPWRERNDDPVW